MRKLFHFKEKICPYCDELVAVKDLQKVVDNKEYKWYQLKPPPQIACPKCFRGVNYNSRELFLWLLLFFTSIPNLLFNQLSQWQQRIAESPIIFCWSIFVALIITVLTISAIYRVVFSVKFKKLTEFQEMIFKKSN